MYIDVSLGIALLVCFFLIIVAISTFAIIGWTSFIRELATNDMLKDENDKLKFKIRCFDKKSIIKEADDYND